MSSFSASGVYSKENDLSLTVSPASTSNGGLVGFMKKGKVGVNLVTSIANFEKQYGKLDFSCTAGYSARAFLSQSSKLYFNRVVSSDMPPSFGALKFQYREVPKPVPPTLTINPPIEILTFGTVDVGKDKIQNFIITNTGDSELRFTVNNINTDTNGVFVFDEAQTEITDKEEVLILSGESKNVSIKFIPKTDGLIENNLNFTILNEEFLGVTSLLLQGTGYVKPVLPDISYVPSIVNFGNVKIGTSSVKEIQFTNNTEEQVVVAGSELSSEKGFSYDITSDINTNDTSIDVGATKICKIKFTPITEENLNFNFILTNKNKSENITVQIIGNAITNEEDTSITVNENTWNELTAKVNEEYKKEFTFTNTSDETITLTGGIVELPLSYDDISDIKEDEPFTATAGATAKLALKFNPTEEDSYSTTIRVTSSKNQELNIEFTGMVTAEEIVTATNTASVTVPETSVTTFKFLNLKTEEIEEDDTEKVMATFYDNYDLKYGSDIYFDDDTYLVAYGSNPGEWNNNLSIKIHKANKDTGTFYVDVLEKDNETGVIKTVESKLCSRNPKARDIDNNIIFIEDVFENSDYIHFKSNELIDYNIIPEDTEEDKYFITGNDGGAISSGDIIKGYQEFSNIDKYPIQILIGNGYATEEDYSVFVELDKIAQNRGDAIAVLDIPQGLKFDKASEWKNKTGISSSYSAFYYNWLKIYDSDNQKNILVPNSGYVAGQYAKTDNNFDIYYSPAGYKRGTLSVLGIEFDDLDTGMRGTLEENKINPIIYRNGSYQIFGDYTAQLSSTYTGFVGVRRYINYLKVSVATTLDYVLFDPLNDSTKRYVVGLISSFLQKCKGIEKNWTVICDDSNNTADDRVLGHLYVDVYFTPIGSVRQIHLTWNITKSGQTVTE